MTGGLSLALLVLFSILVAKSRGAPEEEVEAIAESVARRQTIDLPKPSTRGDVSLEHALARRRSCRELTKTPLSLDALSQLLWAAQGVTHRAEGYRTAPSAGALYPLELYVATGEGFYHYQPKRHRLVDHLDEDVRPRMYRAALEQDAVREAGAVFVIAAVYERTEAKYGKSRSPRYVHLEAGHAAQNLLLQAEVLGLGAVPIGAFSDTALQTVLSLPAHHRPLYLIAVGHPR